MIRLMELADINEVIALGELTHMAWDQQHLCALIKQAHGFARVVIVKGHVVAALTAYLWPSDAELLDIAVDAEHRQRGIASQLIDVLIDTCRAQKIARLVCDVASDNVAAQALYAKKHFMLVSRRADYYQRPKGFCDALVMCRTLVDDACDSQT